MKEKISTIAVIQARTSSKRLPGKVLAEIGGRPMIAFQLERLSRCFEINELVIATTNKESDNNLAQLCKDLGVKVVRGDEEDVLSRFVLATSKSKANIIVRITADCPLIDPDLISEIIQSFKSKKIDYLSNISPPTYPDGLDVEVFTKETLLMADFHCKDKREREHVTPWIRNSGKCKISNFSNNEDLSFSRWTVDEPEDLELVRNIVSNFNFNSNFSWKDVVKLEKSKPELFNINKNFKRNSGEAISSGQKIWKRAKKVIPGGNMLLSKRSEMFLPDQWPAYFSHTKGCKVWDLDGNEFIDMSLMSVGTNILGYSHPEVYAAVLECIKKGNMSTLNCAEEVLLAEKLVEMHPWAEMARFARTGGEANAISIRIARAATGREKIALCGYHGWHDWYLATNLRQDNKLAEHLLPGLEAKGVPKSLEGTVEAFSFNKLDQLKEIVSRNNLAAIKMEVQRSKPPDAGFLKAIRELCNENSIVLIFDECTSGFRETYGGIHLKYGIEPDIAVFGKALGNGYAITSVIGKRSVMEEAQNTFISSTFWTERIGPTAALKTLEIMQKEKSWEKITSIGNYLRRGWEMIAKDNDLPITISGIPSLSSFTFNSKNSLIFKTLITQEMLKRGYLASNACYTCIDHKENIIDSYLENLEEVFVLISKYKNHSSIGELLDGPVCHSGFKRLN